MPAFVIKRLISAILTLWAVFTVSFFLMRSAPGGPFDQQAQVPDEIKDAVRRRYQLDRPLLEQYGRELSRTMSLDFGPSYTLPDYSVNDVIAQGFPVSATLGLLALVVALLMGVPAGMWAGLRRGWVDRCVRLVSVFAIAVPNFVLAALLILLFCFVWPVFPPALWGSPAQLVLPVICLATPFAAAIARLTRAGMLETWSQDYIRTAIGKGVPRRLVIWRHAFPAAVTPVVSFLGPATAGILTGSLVVERLFALPGLGSSFVGAAIDRDYPVAMGLVLLYTALLVAANTLVDVGQKLLDPRTESL